MSAAAAGGAEVSWPLPARKRSSLSASPDRTMARMAIICAASCALSLARPRPNTCPSSIQAPRRRCSAASPPAGRAPWVSIWALRISERPPPARSPVPRTRPIALTLSGRHELQPGLDARLLQPGDDRLADLPFLAGIVGQVAEGEAQLGQCFPVALDAVQNGLEFLLHANPPVTPLPAAGYRRRARRASVPSSAPAGPGRRSGRDSQGPAFRPPARFPPSRAPRPCRPGPRPSPRGSGPAG